MRAQQRQRSDDGFTLVEIMTVLIIVAILVTIAVVSYGASVANAKRIVCFDNQRKLEDAMNMYEADTDEEPTALEDVAPYVNQFVSASSCPADGRALVFNAANLTVTCTYSDHQR